MRFILSLLTVPIYMNLFFLLFINSQNTININVDKVTNLHAFILYNNPCLCYLRDGQYCRFSESSGWLGPKGFAYFCLTIVVCYYCLFTGFVSLSQLTGMSNPKTILKSKVLTLTELCIYHSISNQHCASVAFVFI